MTDFAVALEHRPKCEVVSIRGIGGDFGPPPHAFEENRHRPIMETSPFHPTPEMGPAGGLSGQGRHTEGFGRVQDPTNGKVAVVTSATCKPSWVLPLIDIADIVNGQPDEMQRREYRCWARAVWNEQLDDALADCNRAIWLNEGFVRAYATRGLVYTRMGNTAAAAKDYNTALRMNPRLASALYLRGLGKAQTGDTAGAESDIFTARTIDPEIASTYARYNLSP
jgi:tetratricopeptide (TPR) repeat protein